MRGMTIYASDGTTIDTAPQPEPAPIETIDEPTPEPDVSPEVVDSPSESLAAVQSGDPDAIHDAEVVTTEEDGDDAWVHQSEWPHDWLEYKGDKLAIRVPHQNALTALFQAGQACSPEFQLSLTQKFVKRHLSQESIERVLERMSDPDDEEYSGVNGVWNDLLKTIVDIGGKRALKDAEALAAVQNGKAKS